MKAILILVLTSLALAQDIPDHFVSFIDSAIVSSAGQALKQEAC